MTQSLLDWDAPPAQRHSSTSVAAAESVQPVAGTLRALVLEHIRACGELGSTDEEAQLALSMAGSTQRPRRVELVRAGLIVGTNIQRRGASGRLAQAWCAVEHAAETEGTK